MDFQPKSILVTGGSGFIGCHFIRYLLAHPDYTQARIVNLDKMTYAADDKNTEDFSADARYRFVQGDIADSALIAELLKHEQIDTIVNFAAESHVDNSIAGPEAFIQTNIVGTFKLLEAARQYWLNTLGWNDKNCRFHHISTDEVYGTLNFSDAPFTEESPYDPSSPYSASKASADHLVNAYFVTYGLPVTLSNCSNNYGSHQHAEKLIPTVISSCLAQKAIPVYGKGENVRDWVYVEDHCIAVEQIIRKGRLGQSYNVGGGNEWKNIDLVKAICRILDKLHPADKPYESLIEFVQDRQGHDLR